MLRSAKISNLECQFNRKQNCKIIQFSCVKLEVRVLATRTEVIQDLCISHCNDFTEEEIREIINKENPLERNERKRSGKRKRNGSETGEK